ncbi:TetR/AcrR family transcriptional regulator [Streptomyces phaeochromogenes]|uniref:TetR/AcrR family transcriptional regulator n=1 Tax=Streptomyces phaeochromogenes TaxID=1923 RepID=UPI0036871D6A
MPSSRKPRGPYRKGLERREQILRAALEVFAEHGDRGSSLKEIADRVEMSQAGVLHYFGSREELLLAVLEARDALDTASVGDIHSPGEGMTRTVAHNAQQPGLVSLFVTLSSAATDPAHPAHAFFAHRYDDLARTLTEGLTTGRDQGVVRSDISPEKLARLLLAVSDGLQLQWLMNPDVDMTDLVETFNLMCRPPDGTTDGQAPAAP